MPYGDNCSPRRAEPYPPSEISPHIHSAGSVAVLVNVETTPVQLHATLFPSGNPAGRGISSYLLKPAEPSPVLCALPLLEGWRDVDQVRREHQGQGGTTGPRAPRRLRIGVGGDEGDLGPAGDEPGDAAQVGAPDRDRRR